MSIIIKNDGKEKHHSFTASFNLSGNAGRYGWQAVELAGYGANADEAKAELKHQVRDLMDTLQKLDATIA